MSEQVQSIDVSIPKRLGGYRLDMALVQLNPNISRRKIREAIDAGSVYVNRKRVRISSREVAVGDQVQMEYRPAVLRELKQKKYSFTATDILYECKDFVAINKPPGLASQATKDQSVEHVIPILKKYFQSIGHANEDLVLVHRLDKETSGILIVARSNKAATLLTESFKARTMKKTYLALCQGIPKTDTFEERCYLSSIQPKTGLVRKVNSGGKPSYTKFELAKKSVESSVALITCYPETGRSHQLRVHLSLHQLPIIGDKKYGQVHNSLSSSLRDLAAEHHFLHAFKLSFEWESKAINLEAPLPTNMAKAIATIWN